MIKTETTEAPKSTRAETDRQVKLDGFRSANHARLSLDLKLRCECIYKFSIISVYTYHRVQRFSYVLHERAQSL